MTERNPAGHAGADDLRRISGIGPRVAEALEALGITSFARLAECTPEGLSSRLNEHGLKVSPKVIRNWNWIGQAKRRSAAASRAGAEAARAEPAPEPEAARAEPAPEPEAARAATAPSGATAQGADDAERRLHQVEVAVAGPAGSRAVERRAALEATVSFMPPDRPERIDPFAPPTARVRLFAVSLDDGARRLVGIDDVPIEPGGQRQSTRYLVECPPRGRYRFEATVQMLDRRHVAGRGASGPVRVTA
jgi:hypothetical protein